MKATWVFNGTEKAAHVTPTGSTQESQ